MVDNQGYDRERDRKAARNKRQRRMRDRSNSAHAAAREKRERGREYHTQCTAKDEDGTRGRQPSMCIQSQQMLQPTDGTGVGWIIQEVKLRSSATISLSTYTVQGGLNPSLELRNPSTAILGMSHNPQSGTVTANGIRPSWHESEIREHEAYHKVWAQSAANHSPVSYQNQGTIDRNVRVIKHEAI